MAAGRYRLGSARPTLLRDETSFEQALRVSHRQLVARTLTVDLKPVDTQRASFPSPPGCNR